ncbi:MAG: type I restriction endonuclease subunit R [Planctomycetaceae bacterium]|jgi:type I restriction enzyme R subunit|nr:type I restriction endonuclease subunit R [Planctomycetaceae bacterium]
MIKNIFTERNYENAVLELFRDELGYETVCGYDVKRDYHSPLFVERLEKSLRKINPNKPTEAINEAIYRISNYESNNLIQQNIQFTNFLQNGVEVNYHLSGKNKSDLIRLVDFEHPDNNDFILARQWTIIENEEKRPDLIIFVNGLPLVVIELKSCFRENTDVSKAYRQLQNYMCDIPSLFIYNAFMVISDFTLSKAGTITATEERFMEWKTVDGIVEDKRYASFETLFRGMFDKKRFLNILQHFVLYSHSTEKDVKILAGYHQYFAVKKATQSTCNVINKTRNNKNKNGKAGVVWHSTGSGKSLTMVFYSHLLQNMLQNPTIVILTDRNDLDNQLYTQFCKCKDYLRQEPQQAVNRSNLKKLLKNRVANGIFFTTMQKFEASDEPLSKRSDIILIADEAHRSQYSFNEKIDSTTGKIKLGFARLIRNSLPNATFIGFTGTPISFKDKDTQEVFGDYVDIYDMTQSVNDGITKPIYYESRVVNLGLNESILKQIDERYDIISQDADEQVIEQSKKQLAVMDKILGSKQALESLCNDIVQHYEQRQERRNLSTEKAMIVAYSRSVALEIYNKILCLRPAWNEKIKVVITSDNNDPKEWKTIIGTKEYRKNLEHKFKDENDEMKIAVVVDMWTTGFDVPCLSTMYIYKPLHDHTLIQTISRVNRVFEDKTGGLIVDYVGIASAIKKAMKHYTQRDQEQFGDPDVTKTVLPKFLEKLEVCRALFHGFDLHKIFESKFIEGTDRDRASLIVDGINFILGNDDQKKLFIKEALLLKQFHLLCGSLLSKPQRFESAFFEAVRVAVSRTAADKKLSLQEINKQINELLKQSIKSDGIINLFTDVREEFSIFELKFLQEIAAMKQKNLAAELLRKLLREQVTIYQKTNIVQSMLFSERMELLMNKYRNGQLTNAEVISELLEMASDIIKDHDAGRNLGLTVEEKAFYDAITKPEGIKDFYDNATLIKLTQQLTELLRNNRTIDWQKKETSRAAMRSMIKRLLKKFKYPPEGVENATTTVISQCEMWVDQE